MQRTTERNSSFTEVTSLRIEGNKIRGVEAKDLVTGEELSMDASFFINAAGAWANRVLKLAGLHIGMALSKGCLLITNRRLTHRVINHCRPPSDGGILVPNETLF